jgi:hypothetical protein
LCIDTADPARIASFWESALGWRLTWQSEGEVCLEPPEGSPEDGIAPDLVFLKVPEGKAVNTGCTSISRRWPTPKATSSASSRPATNSVRRSVPNGANSTS